jgi:ribonuclease BN (tRNA processing enzyme)
MGCEAKKKNEIKDIYCVLSIIVCVVLFIWLLFVLVALFVLFVLFVCIVLMSCFQVVILGDTCDPSGLAHLATKCNLLIHEVTMRDVNRAKCYKRGHSTASMAGQFAASIQAKDVVVTHFGGEIR